VKRRRFLVGAAAIASLAGCAGGDAGRGPSTTDEPAATVTTTSAEAIEIRVAQVVIRSSDDGPRAHYRFENTGSTDATIEVTTVLHVEGGGSYEASAYTDVPADSEVILEYRILRWDSLSEVEQAGVRDGQFDFDVFLNGEERPDA
jgi:hypothetical protein